MPLRAHRDNGPVNIKLKDDKINQGNFRAVLAYRARADGNLKQMLRGEGQRNKYISPGIQNDIAASGKAIIDDIVCRINKAKAFSILADETADISISIGVKYYDCIEKVILAIIIVQHLFSYGLPLSKSLQSKNIDVIAALHQACNLTTVLEKMRAAADLEFKKLFRKVQNLASDHDVDIQLPRLVNKQCHGANPKVNDLEEYYRITVFMLFFDSFLRTLMERFQAHRNLFSGFSSLLPPSHEKLQTWTDGLDSLITYYEQDDMLEGKTALQAKFHLWYQTIETDFVKNKICLPSNSVEALTRCN
ncbi:unnamed protein product [Psylliodes chrysocephalus]|uniref:DUF4371 domain-containing protein n=1 Tax=Psylliodes chrysocephalus TaxID=3402493 RepID=A0A9P0D5M7_9CUCU|nr:unnamed protein product [Psylliodes chrysocephala]